MKLNQETKNFLNAITEALREIEARPEDSMQDIFNEKLKSWETGLWMSYRYEIETEED